MREAVIVSVRTVGAGGGAVPASGEVSFRGNLFGGNAVLGVVGHSTGDLTAGVATAETGRCGVGC